MVYFGHKTASKMTVQEKQGAKMQNSYFYNFHNGFLDLNTTLFCGQCFHFLKTGPTNFQGVIGSTLYYMEQQPNGILFSWNGPKGCVQQIKNYFDLDTDYQPILQKLQKNTLIKQAVLNYPGLRLIHQDPFECLCTFILSQNNNITRITGLVQRLCMLFGTPIDNGYTFPTAKQLLSADEEQWKQLRAGFRQKYLLDAANKVATGQINFEKLQQHSDHYCKNKLMEITGVGPKVADCVLLFGLHRLRCVPMDVWMKRIICAFPNKKMPRCTIPWEGIAQQFLFCYARDKKDW